ncbi:MAG: helix-turn-helix transcriptional regulator [Lachnospiraceae bacterium]|nr:helix-turn-helix transcriptional regulator [Lachnospiraceae bacterium]
MENKEKYNFQKLWHLLLDKNMTKKELAEKAEVSVSSMARLKKGIPLSYDRMQRICKAVGVSDVKDIMDKV